MCDLAGVCARFSSLLSVEKLTSRMISPPPAHRSMQNSCRCFLPRLRVNSQDLFTGMNVVFIPVYLRFSRVSPLLSFPPPCRAPSPAEILGNRPRDVTRWINRVNLQGALSGISNDVLIYLTIYKYYI